MAEDKYFLWQHGVAQSRGIWLPALVGYVCCGVLEITRCCYKKNAAGLMAFKLGLLECSVKQPPVVEPAVRTLVL